MAKQLYFNFPVEILKGFLINDKKCLNDILYYAVYAHSLNLEGKTPLQKFVNSSSYFGVKIGNKETAFEKGELLYDSISLYAPKTGIEKGIYWDFYDNEKTEFEKMCLLAFLALKSIIGIKPYTKATNLYLWSRMDGNNKAFNEVSELSKEIKAIANRYKTDLIKTELQNNWGLKMYSRYTRGFYVSFSIDLSELIFQAEKKRKSRKEKELKQKKLDAYKIAIERLNQEEINTS